jgi:hypothetical protein
MSGRRITGPVYAYRERHPTALAKEIHRRCSSAIARMKKRGHEFRITRLRFSPVTTGDFMQFSIKGQSSADAKRWVEDYQKLYGPLALKHALEHQGPPDYGFRRHIHGKLYGYDVEVKIDLQPFDIHVETQGQVPDEILRCFAATYNSLIAEFGR